MNGVKLENGMSAIRILVLASIVLVALSSNCNAQTITYNSEQFHELVSNDKNNKVYEPENKDGTVKSIEIAYSESSTVKGRLSVEKQVLVPPVIFEPLEIIASKSAPEDDIIIIALSNYEEKSSYRAILYRMVSAPNGLITIEVDAKFKYSGFGKSTKEFQKVKAALVRELFALKATKIEI
jgi:hypothetical protein